MSYKLIEKKYKKKAFVIDNKNHSSKKLINRCIDYVLEYVINMNGWVGYETEILLIIYDNDEYVYEILKILSGFNAVYTILGEYNKVYESFFLSKGLCVKFQKEVQSDKKITLLIKDESELIVSGFVYDDIELLIKHDDNFLSTYEYSVICREFSTRKDIEFLFKNNNVKKMALKSKLSN